MSRPVVFLTGGSKGIGAAAAQEFARRGYDLALLARSAEELEQVAQKVRALGSRCVTFVGDVSNLTFAQAAVSQTELEYGRIDVLVNNAAWRDLVTMRQISVESWEKTLAICLTAPAFLARWCAVVMEKRGGGVIINISSINALQAAGSSPAYVAAKGGMDALTYELAALYGSKGIRVVGLSLGAIDTEMSADYSTPDGESLTRDMRIYAEDIIPLQRFGTADEAAKTIAMLASPDASYVHGTNVVADGGWVHSHAPHGLKKRQFPGEFS